LDRVEVPALKSRKQTPKPSIRREDAVARALASEYDVLFRDLRISGKQGPIAVMHKLQELIGERGVDVERLRARLNAQLVGETKSIVEALLDDPRFRMMFSKNTLGIPAAEAFAGKIDGIRELYLDDAVARIEGEQDDLKRTFLERLRDWAEGEKPEIDVGDIIERMKDTADGRAQFFARDQFSRFNRSVAVASYQQAEADYVEWITSNDIRVRDTHRERNHRIFTTSELLADPEWKAYNCRCGFAPVWGPLTDAQQRRRWR
jgi:SPP1 gp7 family putative phage head morphogenesis protein